MNNEMDYMTSDDYENGVEKYKNNNSALSKEEKIAVFTGIARDFAGSISQVTLEYFNAQQNIYYEDLNAYIKDRQLKSSERLLILQDLSKMNESYLKQLENAETDSEIEQVKKKLVVLEKRWNDVKELYVESLNADYAAAKPQRPDLISGIRSFFSGIFGR